MNCSCAELVDIQLGHGVEHPPLRQALVGSLIIFVAHSPAAGSVNSKYLDLLLLARPQVVVPFERVVCSGITEDQDHSILGVHLQPLPSAGKY